MRIGGYAAVACAFIPNTVARVTALLALVEFNIEAPNGEHGLGSEHCCKNLKWVLKTIEEGMVSNDI